MTKENRMLYDALIDYVSYFYNCSDMPENAKINIIKIFEHLLDENINVNDFIPVVRKIQLSLDTVGVV